MLELQQSDPTSPGYTRRGRGRGFEYFDADGRKISDPAVLDRLRALAIPPAWGDVWISPHHDGHLQALGTDAAGRRQYRYHDDWRKRKDLEKFEAMLGFARRLPAARDEVRRLLADGSDLGRERILALCVRLLDHGFFRVGTEEYAEANDTFGLATIRKEHVTVGRDGTVTFDYAAKGAKRRVVQLVDEEVREIVSTLRRRRSGGDELLAYRGRGSWTDVRSADVNAYIKELVGPSHSAKDFRTWNATVYAAVSLAVAAPVAAAGSETARTRAKAFSAREVAELLGNTPTVARSSYIDPRVYDRFDDGWTIRPTLEELGAGVEPGTPAFQGEIEAAVLDLLEERTSSARVGRAEEMEEA